MGRDPVHLRGQYALGQTESVASLRLSPPWNAGPFPSFEQDIPSVADPSFSPFLGQRRIVCSAVRGRASMWLLVYKHIFIICGKSVGRSVASVSSFVKF